MNLKLSTTATYICFLVVSVSPVMGLAQAAHEKDPAELVRWLPTNMASTPPDPALVQEIAKLGDNALPLLEKELRLGIPFKDLNRLLQNSESRRYAVVMVLAQIPSQRSTELLVRSLSDSPENLAMQYSTLQALAARSLSPQQIIRMLGNYTPKIVLAGIAHAEKSITVPEVKTALERIFDKDNAVAQFHNEYGSSTANEDALWEVRLAAGKVLKKDMVPEMQSLAKHLLARLRMEVQRPSNQDKALWMSYVSESEMTICGCLGKLSALGQPIKDLVVSEAHHAEGDYAKVLDMALVDLGERSRVAQVIGYLKESPSHTLRYCAAMTLRVAADRSAIPALRIALRDPYHRQDGSCLGNGREIYPIRVTAADALINLGEDPKSIRELTMGK